MKKIAVLLAATSAAGALAACGTESVNVSADASPQVKQGAEIFYEHCSGCHTLAAAGAQGSATNVHDRERTDGPNFDQRKETVPNVLYAIRNGGFSGAIMPQNVVTGQEAQDVAEFLAQYSGSEAATPKTPPPSQSSSTSR